MTTPRSTFRLPDLKRALNAAASFGYSIELDLATGRMLFNKQGLSVVSPALSASDTPPDVLAELEAKLGRG